MTSRFILFITLVFAASFAFTQDLHKQSLAGMATVEFPGKPTILDTLGQKVYSYTDEHAIYLVIIQNLSNQKDFQLREGKLDGFYNGSVKGFMEGSKGKLIERNPFDLNGLKGTEIEFTSQANPELPDLRFTRFLFLNNILFTVNYWTASANKLSTQADRNKFFASFVITADKKSIHQFTLSSDEDRGYKFGYLLGEVLGAFLVAGGVVVFVLIVTRERKKR